MKKKITVIAMMAVFLIGSALLFAVEYDICVHINGAADGYYQIPIGSANQDKDFSSSDTFTFTVTGSYPTNFIIVETGRMQPHLTDSYSIGNLDPNSVNHVYLDVLGQEPEPDPEPNNE